MKNTPKILLLEDELIIAAHLSVDLQKLGYEVLGIHAFAENAFKTISKNPPDLVLLNVHLRGRVNGIEAARYIMEQYQVPSVFISGISELTLIRQVLKTNPYGFLPKPFQFSTLKKVIKGAIGRILLEQNRLPFSIVR